jgi:hypothetical protein
VRFSSFGTLILIPAGVEVFKSLNSYQIKLFVSKNLHNSASCFGSNHRIDFKIILKNKNLFKKAGDLV